MLSHTLSHTTETDPISVRLRWLPNPGFVTDFSSRIVVSQCIPLSLSAYFSHSSPSEIRSVAKVRLAPRGCWLIAVPIGKSAFPRSVQWLTNLSSTQSRRQQRNWKSPEALSIDSSLTANWNQFLFEVADGSGGPLLCATSMTSSVNTAKAW